MTDDCGVYPAVMTDATIREIQLATRIAVLESRIYLANIDRRITAVEQALWLAQLERRLVKLEELQIAS